MSNHIRMEVFSPGQLSIIIENEGDNLAELDVQLAETDLIVTTMDVKGKQKGKLACTLFRSLISYAREHYLHIISFNSYIDKRLREQPQMYGDVWE